MGQATENNTMKLFETWPELAWVLLAIMGGIARYLDSYLKSGDSPKFALIIAHAAISGFSGYMVAQIMLKVQPDWALIAAGIGGYLGTQGLDLVAEQVKKRLDLDNNSDYKGRKKGEDDDA